MDSRLWPGARRAFVAALVVFVYTTVVGALNGLDVFTPSHETLMTHVHSGTLGWIALGVTGAALLMFGRRGLNEREVATGDRLSWAMIGAIVLTVAAFFTGDTIWRPIAGTVLFAVTIWFLVWMLRNHRRSGEGSVPRLGLILSWISLLMGAFFGVILGIFMSEGEVPGIGDDTALAIAEAHPPAMVIGFLILAALALSEWLLRPDAVWTRSGAVQMWLLFAAGILVNIAILSGLEEELLGPANLLMIVGIVMLVARCWAQLRPSGWSTAGTGAYPRVGVLFLVAYLALGTTIMVRVVSGTMDLDALTEGEEGLLLTFDHTMFVGVMTMLLLGVMASRLRGSRLNAVDRIVLWGAPVGLVIFAIGLMALEDLPKQIGTPIMGGALLAGIGGYLWELSRTRAEPTTATTADWKAPTVPITTSSPPT